MTHTPPPNTYVWQHPSWPAWQFNIGTLACALESASKARGVLLGRIHDAGAEAVGLLKLAALTDDAVKSHEIEGESLNVQSVRTSLARRLGVDIGAIEPSDRLVEGVVNVALDATQKWDQPLSKERLFAWHRALFPDAGYRLVDVNAGAWRTEAHGAMQVVSPQSRGGVKVHYQAPPAESVDAEMDAFLSWFNRGDSTPLMVRAAIAHLWFVTIHPFEDGNGRIGRAIGDMLLARADQSAQRAYSMSAQIMRDRKAYYELLEATQKGDLDVTDWVRWFLESVESAIGLASAVLDSVLVKSKFWNQNSELDINARQKRVLNRLLDGDFEGKLTNKKWQTLAKTSPDTALRDIGELVQLGVLQARGAGRGVHYVLTGSAMACAQQADR